MQARIALALALALSAVTTAWLCGGGLRADQPGPQPQPTVLWAGPSAQAEPAPIAEQPAQPTTDRANPLPHITIDKQRRRVMLDCRTLHPGIALELIGCMPNSREHESVVVVRARPQHVHLALLVCGYEPGTPATWDEEKQKAIPPSGDPIDILVKWTDPKTQKERTVPIEDWLAANDPAKPVPELHWLFTGSRKFENGQYLADFEGSVISISNFPDAVMDLPGIHTSDNARLEFKSNEQTMPPAGTPCTLILLPPATLKLTMDRFGKVTVHGRTLLPSRWGDTLSAHKRSRDDARVELAISPEAVAADVDKLLAACREAGFPADRIDRKSPSTQPDASLFPANDPRAARDLLAAQWRQHSAAFARGLSAQQQWLDQLEQRRRVLGRQYDELTGYLDSAGRQYRQAIGSLTKK